MEVRSSRRMRTLVTRMAQLRFCPLMRFAGALIPIMARSTALQSEAGYIDARPLTTSSSNLLATHGPVKPDGAVCPLLIR
jgi:hypothetical protein